MKYLVPFTLLAASVLAACAAPLAPAPAPSAAPAAAPAAAPEGDDSRAIHGSTIQPSLTVNTSGTTINLNTTVTSGVIIASAPPPIGQAQLHFASDSLAVNRMGFWNPVSVDANGGSNANYGQDLHLQLILPDNVPAGTTMSKVSLQDTTSGGKWDSFGYPATQFVGVYSPDGLTQLLTAGSTTNANPIGANQWLNLYMDTGNGDLPQNMVRSGDSVNVQVTTSAGTWSWTALRP